jgi:hypothetical protein
MIPGGPGVSCLIRRRSRRPSPDGEDDRKSEDGFEEHWTKEAVRRAFGIRRRDAVAVLKSAHHSVAPA